MKSASERMRPPPIRLECQGEGHQTIVVPEDGDRFVVQTKKAIEILRMMEHAEAFEAQLKLLLNRLAAWGRSTEGVAKLHLTLGDAGLLLLAVRSGEYSRDLEDALSELDLEIANHPDFDRLRLDVMAVPALDEAGLNTFLRSDFNLVFVCGAD